MTIFIRVIGWIVFSFLYFRSMEMVLTLAADSNYHSVYLNLVAGFLFNVLVAYLINKYEPTRYAIAALVIGCVGIGVLGVVAVGSFAHFAVWFWVFLIASLVIATFMVERLKRVIAKQTAK